MLMPRAFKNGAVSPPSLSFDDKDRPRSYRPTLSSSHISASTPTQPISRTSSSMVKGSSAQKRNAAALVTAPTKPVEIPDRKRSPTSSPKPKARQTPTVSTRCAESVPPSIAALLAITTIPPHRPGRVSRRRTTGTAHVTIDELVESWKADDTLRSSLASSPSMSILLEEANSLPDPPISRRGCESGFRRPRSASTDSVPSLDGDRSSVLSLRSPSTPGSLRSRRSINNLRHERQKSTSLTEDCLLDHPLLAGPQAESSSGDDEPEVFQSPRNKTAISRSSFRSNLTTSLQALKNVALNSISSLTSSTQSAVFTRGSAGPEQNQMDDALWSHPFLFPRLSSELRPTIQGTPTKAQRRYLNPMPLTFEEQEAPFQKALHAPYLAEAVQPAPTIQLQTYTRGRRRAQNRTSQPDPQSEAGRAQYLLTGIRQREPRENANFLRVVVLEMNMRRAGKLETGRARIWLPPRQVTERADDGKMESSSSNRIPLRWRGICAT